MKLFKYIMLFLFYLIANNLPKSISPIIGPLSKKLREIFVKVIFKKTGKNVNVENHCYFGKGFEIEIGNNSGIGKNCRVPSNLIIGNDVMMGEETIILNQSHNFSKVNVPMNTQGYNKKTQLEILDDVWIGTRVIILSQVTKIGKGAIIGAGSVVTKNVPDYAIIAGNPAKVIKYRI